MRRLLSVLLTCALLTGTFAGAALADTVDVYEAVEQSDETATEVGDRASDEDVEVLMLDEEVQNEPVQDEAAVAPEEAAYPDYRRAARDFTLADASGEGLCVVCAGSVLLVEDGLAVVLTGEGLLRGTFPEDALIQLTDAEIERYYDELLDCDGVIAVDDDVTRVLGLSETAPCDAQDAATEVASETDASEDAVEAADASAEILIEQLSLTAASKTAYVGLPLEIVPVIAPEEATNRTLRWKTSNANVAVVSDGIVTGVSAGKVTVSATAQDGSGVKALIKLTVQEPTLIEGIALSSASTKLYVGDQVTIEASITPGDATNQALTWKSANTAVATVSDGVVEARAAGNVTISATAQDGTSIKAVRKFTVLDPVLVQSIALSSDETTLEEGSMLTLTADIEPANATDQSLLWKTSNAKVATVQDGVVTGVAPGKVTVSATAQDGSGVKTWVSLKVTDKQVPVERIVLDSDGEGLCVGDSLKLTATVSPANATDQSLLWKTSNAKIATVRDGVVTALSAGKVTISATAQDGSGVKTWKSFNVAERSVPVETIALSAESTCVYIGETLALNAEIAPSDATDQSLTWKTSNAKVATVQDGVVTGVAAGSVTISATAQDGSGVKTWIKLTVARKPVPVESITLDADSTSLYVDEAIAVEATVLPADADDRSLLWKTSNANIATVEEGIVTGIAPGSVTISATAQDGSGVKALYRLTVVAKPVKVQFVMLTAKASSVYIGDTLTLTASVGPQDATDPSLAWSSSNAKVAAVKDGVVTGVSAGTATITAAAQDGSGVQGSFTVKVSARPVPVSAIVLAPDADALVVGDTLTLRATVSPANATNPALTWSTSNAKVATVKDGVVTGVAEGSATISAAAQDGSGVKALYMVTVDKKPVSVTAIALSTEDDETTLCIGEAMTIVATVSPADATNPAVIWKSSNTQVATVEDGVVTGLSAGTVTVSATAQDGSGVKTLIRLTVTKRPVPVTAIDISSDVTTLKVGATAQLTAQVTPSDATDPAVGWRSGNTQIATVDDDGLVTAVGPGTAVIWASAQDGSGVLAVCWLTVTQPVTSITLSAQTTSLNAGESVALTAAIEPENATDDSLTWKSANTDVATVDEDGVVTALSAGSAVIIATAQDGSGVMGFLTVTVVRSVTKITLNHKAGSLEVGNTCQLTATLTPSDAVYTTVTWTSSNTSVATVSSSGLITAIGAGSCTITASVGNVAAQCQVTVTEPEEEEKSPSAAASAKIEKLIAAGLTKVGCKYAYGKAGPDTFDCSGLVVWCYAQVGISVYHKSTVIAANNAYTKVTSINDLQRGDVICFAFSGSTVDHVAIALGNGWMLEASSGYGAVRKTNKLTTTYYKNAFVCGRRIIE